MLDSLDRDQRLRLMKFVCSFAWADLEVQDAERRFIARMVRRLKLDPDEIALVEGWLQVPPPAHEIDPSEIPASHRRVFLDAIRGLIEADGDVAEKEAESLALFEALVQG